VSLILLDNHQIGFSVSVGKSEKIAPDRCVSIQETRGAKGFDLRQSQTVGYLAIFYSTGELPHTQAYFYRTAAGAEIDLVLIINCILWAIKVKHSTTPKLTKGFHLTCQDIKPDNKFVVYSGKEKFKTKDGVIVVSLPQILEILIQSG